MGPPEGPVAAGDLTQRQIERERAQRDAALGKRAKGVLNGEYGPVLKRWVSIAVLPTAERLRYCFSESSAESRRDVLADRLGSPVFGVPSEVTSSRELWDVLGGWFLKGDNGRDLTLAVLGTVFIVLAKAKDSAPVPLTSLLMQAGDAARETALGQFVTQVQGAKAMLQVRKGQTAGSSWIQRKKLDGIATLLGGQVRGKLNDDPDAEIVLGVRKVVSVISQKGLERMVTLRVPSGNDWDLLQLASRPESLRDTNRTVWASFAMLVLCGAQAEAGLFDIAEIVPSLPAFLVKPSKRRHRKATGLVFSQDAYEAISKDIDKWMRLGFSTDPMLVKPPRGDYLTVKHRPVAGGRGPMGHKTKAEESAAFDVACNVMGNSAWAVNGRLLEVIQSSAYVRSLVEADEPNAIRREMILNAHRKLASEAEFYLPLYMDFRGRVYPRTNLVTYQGSDLQKALLCFPKGPPIPPWSKADQEAKPYSRPDPVCMHASNLYDGPNRLSKATYKERFDWWSCKGLIAASDLKHGVIPEAMLNEAAKPLQLLGLMLLCCHDPVTANQIACQIDGTCNGLQHLTALFRDETAAPWVNLSGGPGAAEHSEPQDIYGEVAQKVRNRLNANVAHPNVSDWSRRILTNCVIDRKLLKGPVMVLPYGGTLGTVEEELAKGLLGQEPSPFAWTHGFRHNHGEFPGQPQSNERFVDWTAGGYEAYWQRPLAEHPLFHADVRRLAKLVWACIEEVIPKAMQAMQTFRDIAKAIGPRVLEWDTGFATLTHDSLWVTQAKPKSARSTLKFKGYSLPNSVRGLSLREGRDEVDPASHTSGIVANFIHSNDAAHLAGTMEMFAAVCAPGEPVPLGANHDCFITRPSHMSLLGKATREAFVLRYLVNDPLGKPVHVDDMEGHAETYASWYELAKHCGVEFPVDGTWDPRAVRTSPWFFS